MDGWDDDDAALDELLSLDPTDKVTSKSPLPTSSDDLFVVQFQTQANASFETTYNNDRKARELVAYYNERPELATYTLDKELHRLHYEIIVDENTTIVANDDENKSQQAHYLGSSWLCRCANQSLLADVVAVLTDVANNNNMSNNASAYKSNSNTTTAAVVTATSCVFAVNLQDNSVVARANFVVTFHNNNNNKRVDALVHVQFAPRVPTLHYRVERVIELQNDCDETITPTLHDATTTTTTTSNTHLNQHHNHPTTEYMNSNYDYTNNNSDPSYEQDQIQQQLQRPTSLLRGLVGWGASKMAIVSLPQEVDASVYQEWEQQQRMLLQQPTIPSLYQLPQPPPVLDPYDRVSKEARAHKNQQQQLQKLSSDSNNSERYNPPRTRDTVDHRTISSRSIYNNETTNQHEPTDNNKDHMEPTNDNEPENDSTGNGWDDADLDGLDEIDQDTCDMHDDLHYDDSAFGQDDIRFDTSVWQYDPATDIIPTRERWINPFPASRRIDILMEEMGL
jgi:hypothetical protein